MPKIHNRGRKIGSNCVARKISFPADWDENGNPARDGKKYIEIELKPGAHMSVTNRQFAHLKSLFPDEIINVDDITDMQAQFKEPETEKPRAGYVHPDDVDALVEKRVQERLARDLSVREPAGEPESREDLIKRIDGMDRLEIISFAEKNKLSIDFRNLKAPAAAKAAVFAALEGRAAAAAAPETEKEAAE